MKFKLYIKENMIDRNKFVLDESVDDMEKRCENCNTLLNDSGTCPKCDHGEEDYGDELKEDLSIRERLKAAYPELNFDNAVTEDLASEELSNKEKLKRAYPELNFEDNNLTEELSVREKLKAAYPELNFDDSEYPTTAMTEDINDQFTLEYVGKNGDTIARDYFNDYDEAEKFALKLLDTYNNDNTSGVYGLIITNSDGEELFTRDIDVVEDDFYNDYDDEYEFDDVEQDRVHAALYGGDRMYCDCGRRLVMDEWEGHCPVCDADNINN